MQKQFIKGSVKKLGDNLYEMVASTSAIDRQGDSIDQAGWDLSNFKKNPVVLWAHDYKALPIAKATDIKTVDDALVMQFEFAPAEGNPMAQQIKVLYDEGFVNASSVGFIPKTRNGNVITKSELLEVSLVPVPANQEALRRSFEALDGNTELDADTRTAIKATFDMFQKGAVADELDAEEKFEQKCEKFHEAMEIMYAFADVYFAEETPVEDFGKLMTETIALLQKIVGTDGADDESSETVAAMYNGKTASHETFVKFFESKAGAKLSKDTISMITKALGSIADAQSVLEDLKSSSASQNGEGDGDTAKAAVVDETIHLSLDDVRQLRQSLVANDKSNELSLSIVNAHLKEKGIKA